MMPGPMDLGSLGILGQEDHSPTVSQILQHLRRKPSREDQLGRGQRLRGGNIVPSSQRRFAGQVAELRGRQSLLVFGKHPELPVVRLPTRFRRQFDCNLKHPRFVTLEGTERKRTQFRDLPALRVDRRNHALLESLLAFADLPGQASVSHGLRAEVGQGDPQRPALPSSHNAVVNIRIDQQDRLAIDLAKFLWHEFLGLIEHVENRQRRDVRFHTGGNITGRSPTTRTHPTAAGDGRPRRST